MIKYETGDILNSSAECLVNTVNCEGFMGKGIAYQFKEKFPENNQFYVDACKNGSFSIGHVLLFREQGKLIANFPTKNKWREKSQYSYIQKGLDDLHDKILAEKINCIAVPPVGCGNGGLDWNVVKKIIDEKLGTLKQTIIVYEPSKCFIPKQAVEIPKMTASHLILMKLKGGLDTFNKLRLQKAAYFMNVFSGTEYFKFEEYKFGPYAHSIEILSQQIRAFQESYKVTTVGAEEILYNNLISDSVKGTIEKYKFPILQSLSFVNSIKSNHELEITATIVAIVRLHPEAQSNEILHSFND